MNERAVRVLNTVTVIGTQAMAEHVIQDMMQVVRARIGRQSGKKPSEGSTGGEQRGHILVPRTAHLEAKEARDHMGKDQSAKQSVIGFWGYRLCGDTDADPGALPQVAPQGMRFQRPTPRSIPILQGGFTHPDRSPD